MPNIHIQTNLVIEEPKELKERLGKAIETIPHKTEKWLMIVLEDGCTMYFGGSDLPCALAHVELLGSADAEVYERMTQILSDILSEVLAIPKDRIYTKYSEYEHWGWNGSNF